MDEEKKWCVTIDNMSMDELFRLMGLRHSVACSLFQEEAPGNEEALFSAYILSITASEDEKPMVKVVIKTCGELPDGMRHGNYTLEMTVEGIAHAPTEMFG